MDTKEENFIYVFKWSKNYLIVSNDLVYGFGDNKDAELGLGHNEKVTEWTIIPELCKKQIIEFNDGFSFCTALSIDGKVYSFGSIDYNQLGHKDEEMKSNYMKPKIIETLYNEFVDKVSCGSNHSLGLTRNQEVYGWGSNSYGQIGVNSKEITQSIAVKIKGFNDEKIQSISCGFDHSMALTVNGNVFSWGLNSCGQLGINSTEHSYTPQMIKFSDEPVLFDRITCGYFHSLLLSKNGHIYSFGSNAYNQLGYKTSVNKQLIPQIIEMKTKINFSEVFCHTNGHFSTGLTSNDKLCYIWGECGVKGEIESPEKTEYNSCIQAVNSFLPKYLSLKEFETKIDPSNNYFENTFNEIKRLGTGSYGAVFEAENKMNKRCFAIKKIQLSSEQFKEGKVWREIEFLSTLKSEYVIEYENAWIETEKQSNNDYILYIKMELCSKTLEVLNTELMTELQCKHSLINNRIVFYILSQLLTEVIEGVNYLHKNNIIHRDLKPSNILISEFINGRIVKIADFGISCFHRMIIENNEVIGISHTGNSGDIDYMAPELLFFGRLEYSYKVDIYSLGIIFNELTLGNYRLSIDTFNDSLKSKIQSLKQITEKMISERPEDRPDCKEILKDINKYFMNLLDLNEFEDIWDNLKINHKKYNTFCMKYIENKLYYHIVCGKTIPQNIISSFSHILCLPMFESYHNGYEHCIARTNDGMLYSFGSKRFHQLGYQTEKDYNYRPKLIESLNNVNVIQVSCGSFHTLIVTQNKDVYGWGHNYWGQIGNNIKGGTQSIPIKLTNFNNEIIKSVFCGAFHSMALTDNGSVYSWGINKSGQLGISREQYEELIPFKMTELSGEKVGSISCGSYHSMALTDKGNVFGWGNNNWGQLGLKNKSNVFHPKIIAINDTKSLFKKIFCKKLQSLLLSTNDDIYVFGFNQFNQYDNERPDEEILITQMIDKRHPLITFPEKKSNLIPSLPTLGLCRLWLKYASISTSVYLPTNELKHNRNKFCSLQDLRNI